MASIPHPKPIRKTHRRRIGVAKIVCHLYNHPDDMPAPTTKLAGETAPIVHAACPEVLLR